MNAVEEGSAGMGPADIVGRCAVGTGAWGSRDGGGLVPSLRVGVRCIVW